MPFSRLDLKSVFFTLAVASQGARATTDRLTVAPLHRCFAGQLPLHVPSLNFNVTVSQNSFHEMSKVNRLLDECTVEVCV